ncbi:hypothetical protein [Actinokineospora sp.]|uniref:hypothetical protein n=1 Tax=Actinokineospora sp. TaxID=1872133 RepID=UPI004037668E
MAGRRTPGPVVLTAALSVLVIVGALTGAAVLRSRADSAAGGTSTSVPAPTTTTGVGVSGCLREPCQVLATATVGGTIVELVADSGATSGRLRIGGPSASQVIETTITDRGITLTSNSLQCYPASVSACLIRGQNEDGATGQVVVGRSDKWSPLERAYFSQAGYLLLNNVISDSAPEVIAVQHDCAPAADCAKRPVYAQVFGLGGQEIGCSRLFARLDQLPGYPLVQLTAAQLRDCP